MSTILEKACATLWTGSDLDEAALLAALARAGSRGVDWADLYFQHIESHDWLLEEGIVKTGHFSIDRGYGLRTVAGERQALYRRCEAQGVGISVMKAFSGGQLLRAETSPFGRALTEYPIWLAEYDGTPDFYYHFDLWQYTHTGSVPGIQGNVDLNLLLREPAQKET